MLFPSNHHLWTEYQAFLLLEDQQHKNHNNHNKYHKKKKNNKALINKKIKLN